MTKPCPFCAEPIAEAARKCKRCGEYLDAELRAATVAAGQKAEQPLSAKPLKKTKRNAVFAILLLMLSAKIFARLVFPVLGGLPPDVEPGSPAHVQHIANETNAKLPIEFGTDMRLVQVSARDRELVYDAEILSRASRDVDHERFLAHAAPLMRAQACRDRAMAALRNYGITTTLRFLGNDHVEIASLSVSPADCAGLAGTAAADSR